LLQDLTSFLDLIANGLLPSDYYRYDFFSESRLIAILKSDKDSRDIRHIDLPELYSKLVGNMLTRMLSAKIKEILGPVQLGCGFQFRVLSGLYPLQYPLHLTHE
jgi:hypothetical protein